jgi:hypothetical protein
MADKVELETLPQPIKIFLSEESGLFVAVDVNAFFEWISEDNGDVTSDPAGWGVMLADVLMHVARAHAQAFSQKVVELPASSPHRRALTEEAIRKRILNVLLEEVKIGPRSIMQLGAENKS